jgi:hypothetical protein
MSHAQTWKWMLMGLLVLAAMLMGFLSSNTSNVAMALDKPTPQPTPIIKKGGEVSSAVSPNASQTYRSWATVRGWTYGSDEVYHNSSSSAAGVYSLQVWSDLWTPHYENHVWNSCYCTSLTATGRKVIDKNDTPHLVVNGTHLFDYGGGNWVWKYSYWHY